MKKGYRLLGVILAIMMFITGCGCSNGALVVDKDTKRPEATGESWTVFLYMCAGELEENYGRAGEVLSSLSYDLPENINVIVETGGCKSWQKNEIKNDRIQDYAVQKNGIKLINESLMKNMGDSDTYAEFLKRNIEKYPADHYISVVWGNGGGPVDGVCYDASYNYDVLTLDNVVQAHSAAGVKFDIIGFDASLMSTLETASALSVYADYLVASEDIMPMSGWNYRGLFEHISTYPQASALEVGQVICDGVIANDNSNSINTVMAVTDLSKATRILQAFEGMAITMSETTSDSQAFCSLMKETDNVYTLGANSDTEGCSNLVDIVSLANCVFNATSDDSARLGNVVSKAVPYLVSTDENTSMCGLGVYYPIERSAEDIKEYRNIYPGSGYMEFIDRTDINELTPDKSADYKETVAWQHYSEVVGYNSIAAYLDPLGVYTLTVNSPEIVSNAAVNVYKYDEESGQYMYMCSHHDTRAGENSYSYEFSEPQIFELNGTPVSAELVSRTENYEIYSIPVLYQDELSSIRVIKTYDGKKWDYSVQGIWKGIDENFVPGRKYKNPGTGDTITPVYRIFGDESGEYVKGKSLRIVFGGASISEKTVTDGDYMISYTITDIYGKKVESNTTNVTALKGKFKAMN